MQLTVGIYDDGSAHSVGITLGYRRYIKGINMRYIDMQGCLSTILGAGVGRAWFSNSRRSNRIKLWGSMLFIPMAGRLMNISYDYTFNPAWRIKKSNYGIIGVIPITPHYSD